MPARIFLFLWHVQNLYANVRSIFSTRLQKISTEEKIANLSDVSHWKITENDVTKDESNIFRRNNADL